MTIMLIALGTLLGVYAELTYIRSILNGETKPNATSWFIFIVSMILLIISSYALGARYSLIMVGVFTMLHVVVVVLSFRAGWVSPTVFEWACIGAMLISVLLWIETSNPWYTLLLNLGVDVCGYAALIYKTYRAPHTEPYMPWFLSVCAYMLNVSAVSVWVPSEYLFSVSNALLCGVVLMVILMRSKYTVRYRIDQKTLQVS